MSNLLQIEDESIILYEPLVASILQFLQAKEPVPVERIRALNRASEIARVHWYSSEAGVTESAAAYGKPRADFVESSQT
jgi:hypothetical protein